MKNGLATIFFLSIIALAVSFQSKPCGVRGDSKSKADQLSDSLKNRTIISKKTNTKITLDSILRTGDDSKRWSEKYFVKIIGYVFDVKYGSAENCNCHSADKKDWDVHIEIVKDLNHSEKTKRLICEINRYLKNSDPLLSYESVSTLKGKKVEIKGWMFYDAEHYQNSLNTNPKGTNDWRASAWELHPVFSIKQVK